MTLFSTLLANLRGELRRDEVAGCVIEVAAKRAARLPLENFRNPHLVRSAYVLGIIDNVAELIIDLPRDERFAAVMGLFDHDDPRSNEYLTREDATHHLLSLIGEPETVRFAFSPSFRAFLTHAVHRAKSGRSGRCVFSDLNHNVCDLALDLCRILELPQSVQVEKASSIPSILKHDCDVEVIMPYFSADLMRQRDEIPERVLTSLGFEQGKTGRVTAEMLSIVDALQISRGRVFITVTDGTLSRMVGAEQMGRRSLVDSGRLQAVLNVPSGMMFGATLIRSNILAIAAADQRHDMVRFVDLGHETLARKNSRGRYDVLEGVSWHALLGSKTPDILRLDRDVPVEEIAANNFVLTPDRYLNTGPKDKIDALLALHEVRTLGDLVEMIRPVSLTESPDGDYQLHDAGPADVNERGFVDEPRRVITVDRPKYLKALNQQLRPNDVVLSIKGNIGVVGVVPDTAPAGAEQTIWTAGQSLMILRIKRQSDLTPVALYEYLSSPTVRDFIHSISGGAAIATIAMKDLTEFPVPLPDAATARSVQDAFERRQMLFDRIEEIRSEIGREQAESWPHRLLSEGAGQQAT